MMTFLISPGEHEFIRNLNKLSDTEQQKFKYNRVKPMLCVSAKHIVHILMPDVEPAEFDFPNEEYKKEIEWLVEQMKK